MVCVACLTHVVSRDMWMQGYTAKEVLQLIESRDMYTHVPLPACLDTPDCPSSVFEFVEESPPLPAHLR
jgi:hypothetical protein